MAISGVLLRDGSESPHALDLSHRIPGFLQNHHSVDLFEDYERTTMAHPTKSKHAIIGQNQQSGLKLGIYIGCAASIVGIPFVLACTRDGEPKEDQNGKIGLYEVTIMLAIVGFPLPMLGGTIGALVGTIRGHIKARRLQ